MSPSPRTSESLARRIRMARGLEPADLCVEHVNVVDVFSRTLLRAVHVNNAHRCCFCTDDSSPADLLERGHMDEILRLAVAEGLDPLLAVGMAALNGCVFYGMRGRGGIAPGWAADFCLVDDLRGFRVREVFDPYRAADTGGPAPARALGPGAGHGPDPAIADHARSDPARGAGQRLF